MTRGAFTVLARNDFLQGSREFAVEHGTNCSIKIMLGAASYFQFVWLAIWSNVIWPHTCGRDNLAA
jgi:hypothetical protein